MESLYTVFTEFNNIFLMVFGAAFALQFFYMLICFLPPKKYPVSKEKKKFAIIIPAHNEEKNIKNVLITALRQNYPKDKFDIFVVADNCSDKTAEVAREYGATVFERFETDKKKQGAGFALKYAFDFILKDYDNYDAFIRFDADSIVHPDYITKMNDAFCAGVKLARGYNSTSNFNQGVVPAISGLWYLRDVRFGCIPKSALHISQILLGPGMMFSADIIKSDGGWKEVGISEDADFAIRQLLKGNKAYYVHDAIIYDEQATTIGDVFKRNMRMGRGLIKTFWTKATRCLGKFFITFKFSYLEMFMTELFIPLDFLACLWFPSYYIFAVVFNVNTQNYTELAAIGKIVIFALLIFLVGAFIFQAILVAFTERKRIKAKKSKLILPILLFPVFMIIYALGIFLGILFRPGWKSLNRNKAESYDAFIQSLYTQGEQNVSDEKSTEHAISISADNLSEIRLESASEDITPEELSKEAAAAADSIKTDKDAYKVLNQVQDK